MSVRRPDKRCYSLPLGRLALASREGEADDNIYNADDQNSARVREIIVSRLGIEGFSFEIFYENWDEDNVDGQLNCLK